MDRREQRSSQSRRLFQEVVLLLGQGIAFLALWLVLVGKLETAEIVAGALCSVLATIASRVVSAQRLAHVAARLRWIRESVHLPWLVVAGCGHVFLSLIRLIRRHDRGGAGVFRTFEFQVAGSRDEVGERRALTVVYANTSPDLIVVDLEGEDPEDGKMVVHQLEERPMPPMMRRLGARP